MSDIVCSLRLHAVLGSPLWRMAGLCRRCEAACSSPDESSRVVVQMSGQALRLAMTAVSGLHTAMEQATTLARRSGGVALQWVSDTAVKEHCNVSSRTHGAWSNFRLCDSR